MEKFRFAAARMAQSPPRPPWNGAVTDFLPCTGCVWSRRARGMIPVASPSSVYRASRRWLGASRAEFLPRIRDGHECLRFFNRPPSHLAGVLARRGRACAGTHGCRLPGKGRTVQESMIEGIRQGREAEIPEQVRLGFQALMIDD